MLRTIPISDGRQLSINSNVTCVYATNGYFLSSERTTLFAESDFEMCVSPQSAEMILEHEMAQPQNELLFNRADLARAVFGWDASQELDELERFFKDRKSLRGLDVACGYGRLLIPLSVRGFSIDGIDISGELIKAMSDQIPEGSTSRAMACDVSGFSSPGAYGFAYAAMNSLRFLETKFALRRHFLNLHESLLPGSPYAFCITLNGIPGAKYQRTWSFDFENKKFEIDWIQDSYCHLKDQITERIEIFQMPDRKLIHREYQTQGNYSYDLICEILQRGSWQIEATYDTQFQPRKIDGDSTGSYWFLARRT